MSSLLRVIRPYAILGAVLVVIALLLLMSHHRVAGFVVLGIDAVNMMIMRYKVFRWMRSRRS